MALVDRLLKEATHKAQGKQKRISLTLAENEFNAVMALSQHTSMSPNQLIILALKEAGYFSAKLHAEVTPTPRESASNNA